MPLSEYKSTIQARFVDEVSDFALTPDEFEAAWVVFSTIMNEAIGRKNRSAPESVDISGNVDIIFREMTLHTEIWSKVRDMCVSGWRIERRAGFHMSGGKAKALPGSSVLHITRRPLEYTNTLKRQGTQCTNPVLLYQTLRTRSSLLRAYAVFEQNFGSNVFVFHEFCKFLTIRFKNPEAYIPLTNPHISRMMHTALSDTYDWYSLCQSTGIDLSYSPDEIFTGLDENGKKIYDEYFGMYLGKMDNISVWQDQERKRPLLMVRHGESSKASMILSESMTETLFSAVEVKALCQTVIAQDEDTLRVTGTGYPDEFSYHKRENIE